MDDKRNLVDQSLYQSIGPMLLESILELTSCDDTSSLAQRFEQVLQDLLQIDSASIYQLDRDDQDSDATANIIPRELRDPTGKPGPVNESPLLEQCIRQQQPILQRDQHGRARYASPMIGRRGVSLVLLVVANKLSSEQAGLVEALWKIWRQLFRLVERNELDKLTGLMNRVAFDNRLNEIFATGKSLRRDSDHRTSVLALVDIDHFKQVNDRYGHLYGDEVLVQLARLMGSSFRGQDMVFRFGGEEFVVVLRSCPLEKGREILERFRQQAQEYHYPQVGNKTVSIGMTEITGNTLPTTILDRADKALYFSKQNGRNQCNVYEQLVRDGKLPGTSTDADDVELF